MIKILLEDVRSSLTIFFFIIIMILAFSALKEAAPDDEMKESIEKTSNSFINAFYLILGIGSLATFISIGFWIHYKFN